MVKAVVSNIEIAQLETVRTHYKEIAKVQGKKCRIVFRGPRLGMTRVSTRKKDATGFSVYFV
jgi:hypothetical protein